MTILYSKIYILSIPNLFLITFLTKKVPPPHVFVMTVHFAYFWTLALRILVRFSK